MWVRAVATAVAVWCVSGAAMAAGYAEVWNPPEATGHPAKHAKKTVDGSKLKSTTGAKMAPKHAASGQHAAHRLASVSKSGAKPAHGNVKKVAAKGTAKGAVKGALKPKPAVVVQGKKPHAQLAQAKPGQAKIMHANLVQGHTGRAHMVKVAAKTGPAKPAVSPASAPAKSATAPASPANVTANPATASSGSLPPILH